MLQAASATQTATRPVQVRRSHLMNLVPTRSAVMSDTWTVVAQRRSPCHKSQFRYGASRAAYDR
jgi:hypothetical protein